MKSEPDFRVELETLARGITLVHTFGEIDFCTTRAFRASVARALDEGASRVIVDLSHLAFIDSSGIGALVGAVRRAAQNAVELMVVCPPGDVAHIFSITDLERMMAFYQTRDEALTAA